MIRQKHTAHTSTAYQSESGQFFCAGVPSATKDMKLVSEILQQMLDHKQYAVWLAVDCICMHKTGITVLFRLESNRIGFHFRLCLIRL